MDYEKYLEKVKIFSKNMTLFQKIIGIFVMLLIVSVVVLLLNPQKKLAERRNAQRRSDVANVLNSVYQYAVDNNGQLPGNITAKPNMICRDNSKSCDGLVDISEIIKDKRYLLSAVPIDPKEKDANISGYQIAKLTNGRISVIAPLAENKAVVSLSK